LDVFPSIVMMLMGFPHHGWMNEWMKLTWPRTNLPWKFPIQGSRSYGAFTLNVKSVLNENLGGILGGTQC
jgi:hypothetical protein